MDAVMTRKCRETELQSRGLTGSALECLLAETAQERHLSRVAYARWAAEEYYLAAAHLERDDVSEDTLALMAGAILWADVIGIGGRDGVEGYATDRHPAFASCGKGRKHARDGGAWSAAIYVAALDCGGCFRINDNGALVYSRARGDESVADSTIVDELTMPFAWACSIFREGLRRAAGLRCPKGPGWHPDVSFDAPAESLPAWGKAYNEAEAEARMLAGEAN